ncbi:MAG: NADH-quinone oxidoreductase subunit N [Actinobacteria bacterium QS_8_72_14]|nr:MAG: NADH-quinone oxidoreductase subunit N [Actinobacteria bacterium QS_8_72_14]
MSAVAQAVQTPTIPWAAISPELVLFGAGILVLLLDTAGGNRRTSAAVAFVALLGVAGLVVATGEDVAAAVPVVIAAAAILQLALALALSRRPRLLGAVLAVLGFAGCMLAAAWQWWAATDGSLVATETLLSGTVAVDGVALFTRMTVCVAGIVTVLLGFSYLEDRRVHRGEYYPLLLLSATGMTLLASAADLLMVFIAVEILSLALYVMSGFAKRDLASQESAFKYFLLGAFSSAFLLYGIALVYGAAGTTNIAAAGRALAGFEVPAAFGIAAVGLLLVGLAFKVALVPFHMWTPDVYQGAPTPVTGFMAAATKAAAFAAFLRVFADGLAALQWTWVPAVGVLAAATMLAGAILAVVQDDLKRMLAYSSVAHAGYATMGLLALSQEGTAATMFYLLAYAVMSLGAFGVLGVLERRQRKAIAVADLRGLGQRAPLLAGMFALFLLSLAGIPGTAGFMGKLAVVRAAVDADHIALPVVLVLSSVVAAFFYIRVIVAMFMEDEPAELADVPVPASTGSAAGLSAAAAGVVVLGVVPPAVIDLAQRAATFAG